MADKTVFLVRTSIFTGSRLLTITPENVSIGMTNEEQDQLSIAKDNIDSFRFIARRVRYYIYLYSYYRIDIKDLSGNTIRISLYSFLGIRSRRTSERYNSILRELYHNFFLPLARYYLGLFANEIDFTIAGLILTQQGIKFSDKHAMILWEDVATRDYLSYFSVFSKKDNYTYCTYDYWNDWNTQVLNVVIISILDRKSA